MGSIQDFRTAAVGAKQQTRHDTSCLASSPHIMINNTINNVNGTKKYQDEAAFAHTSLIAFLCTSFAYREIQT